MSILTFFQVLWTSILGDLALYAEWSCCILQEIQHVTRHLRARGPKGLNCSSELGPIYWQMSLKETHKKQLVPTSLRYKGWILVKLSQARDFFKVFFEMAATVTKLDKRPWLTKQDFLIVRLIKFHSVLHENKHNIITYLFHDISYNELPISWYSQLWLGKTSGQVRPKSYSLLSAEFHMFANGAAPFVQIYEVLMSKFD